MKVKNVGNHPIRFHELFDYADTKFSLQVCKNELDDPKLKTGAVFLRRW